MPSEATGPRRFEATIEGTEKGRVYIPLPFDPAEGYFRWIDATKRRPDVRAARIAERVELLKAGRKQRPG